MVHGLASLPAAETKVRVRLAASAGSEQIGRVASSANTNAIFDTVEVPL
jgi:hypothetical protein